MHELFNRKKAWLILEDGTCFNGFSAGAEGSVTGKIVFTTAMTGYQELLTDPGTHGEMVAFTYPLIGNYGVNDEDSQSDRVHARAVVAREICHLPSNFRATDTLPEYLKRHKVLAIEGVDTRALARRLRGKGTVGALVTTDERDVKRAEKLIRDSTVKSNQYVANVSCRQPYVFSNASGLKTAVIDLGVRRSILRALAKVDAAVHVLPAFSSKEEILSTNPDIVVFAGGPGRASHIPEVVDTVKALIGRVSILGLGLGHVVVGKAFGARTKSLDGAHRGNGIPVKNVQTGELLMTSQHHDETVVDQSWVDPGLMVSYVHADDGSIEGFYHATHGIRTIGFSLEGHPGPRDSSHLLEGLLAELMAVPSSI